MKIGTLVRPGFLFVAPLVLSALAWAVPGESVFLRGFSQRSDFGWGALSTLVAWYAVCFLIFSVGSSLGNSLSPFPSIKNVESTHEYEKNLLRILTLLATVGVLYAVFLAQQQGSILASLAESSGNDLSEPLRGGTGIATTRYTTVVAAPFAVLLWLRGRTKLTMALWNAGLLLVSSLFSSRMSLVMATVIFGYIYYRVNPYRRIRLLHIVLSGTGILGILGILNFFRNSRYYIVYGVDSPLLMNFYQILTYLGSPFQVSGAVANSILAGTFPNRGGFIESLEILVPTFFQDKDAGVIVGNEARYANQVDIAGSLTTNSAFADIYDSLGVWGLAWSLLPVLFAGLIYGHCRQYNSGLSLAAGVALYLLAEYWRIFLFNQGIVIYLFAAVIGASFASAYLTKRRIPERV